MNILTMIILAVFLLFAVSGLRKGLVKKMAGIVSLLAASLLVSAALPYITDFLKEKTPVYTYIADQCERVVTQQVTASLLGSASSGNGQGSGSSGGVDRSQIKELLNQYGGDYGLSGDMVDAMSDSQLQTIVNQYLQNYISQSTDSGSSSADLLSLTRVEETRLIQNMPIPDFLKNLMLNYNNSEGYKKLSVDNFAGYLVHFFANIILNIVAFIVTLIAVQILIWIVLTALNLFAKLPVLHLINHLGGLAVGIIQGIFVVWLIFLVIAMCSGTEIGMSLMKMVDESVLLKPLYESNLFLKIVMKGISGIL